MRAETIISWNVNGVRSCAEKGMVDFLKSASPDVFCIQETKALEGQLADTIRQVSGYSSYWTSAKRKGYSGVATYSKRVPTRIEPLEIPAFDDEGRVQILTFPEYTLINAYFPNSQEAGARLSYKLDFCAAILAKCDALVKKGIPVLLCGDYNIAHTEIDLANPKTNTKNPGFLPEERAWMDTFIAAGYVDTFRKFNTEGGNYSWWSYRFNARAKNVGWRIDYVGIDAKSADRVTEAFIRPEVMGSDHCPVGVVLQI